MSTENTQLLICGCSSREHQIIMEHDYEDNLVYCSIHLTKPSFWTRVKYGLKYIFGYQCRYGAFEEFILTEDHIPQLEKVINELKENKQLL